VDNVNRRKWDLEEFEKRAKEREAGTLEEKPRRPVVPLQQRGYVTAREHDIDLTQKLGKTVVISATTPLSQQGGYYCDVCECLVKDSANYLDHINGKKHQRAMGLSMRTERASVDDVKAKLQSGKKREAPSSSSHSDNFEDRVNSLKEREEREKKEKKDKKKEYKRVKREEEEKQRKKEEGVGGDDVLAMMGLPTGFGGGKK